MYKNDAKNETAYQLIKLVLLNLVMENIITQSESDKIQASAQKALDPIVGNLDEICHEK